jgi:hypothetical protein
MDPAKSILDLIGFERAAEVTGKHLSRIYRWTYPTSRGGTGGTIPHADALKLLDHAKASGIPLTADDFLQTPSRAATPEPVSAA